MTVRYDQPEQWPPEPSTNYSGWLAEAGISVAGTRGSARAWPQDRQAPRRGGQPADRRRPRLPGFTRAATRSGSRNARAAGAVEMGPRWRSREVRITEVADDAKPELLKRYLDRWFWEVKGHVGGLTPESSDDRISRRRFVDPRVRTSALGHAERRRRRGDDVPLRLLTGGLPRHRCRVITPGAVEHADDRGPAVGGDDKNRAARVTLLAHHAIGHREPAVVDRFDGAAALPRDHTEVAYRKTGRGHDRWDRTPAPGRVAGRC